MCVKGDEPVCSNLAQVLNTADDAESLQAPMSSTIPRKVIVARDGKSYRGAYSLEGDVVTVRHTSSDGDQEDVDAPPAARKPPRLAARSCANWPERTSSSDTGW
jgi:hypothetical protein